MNDPTQPQAAQPQVTQPTQPQVVQPTQPQVNTLDLWHKFRFPLFSLLTALTGLYLVNLINERSIAAAKESNERAIGVSRELLEVQRKGAERAEKELNARMEAFEKFKTELSNQQAKLQEQVAINEKREMENNMKHELQLNQIKSVSDGLKLTFAVFQDDSRQTAETFELFFALMRSNMSQLVFSIELLAELQSRLPGNTPDANTSQKIIATFAALSGELVNATTEYRDERIKKKKAIEARYEPLLKVAALENQLAIQKQRNEELKKELSELQSAYEAKMAKIHEPYQKTVAKLKEFTVKKDGK